MIKIVTIACLVALLSVSVVSKAMVAGKVIVALNCGSKNEVVDSHDKVFKYEGDEKYVSGNSVPVDYFANQEATEADLLFTFEKKLFMFERHTYNEMTYSLPVRKGKITLILKFAEMYFTLPGQRAFNIKIGNKVIRRDFDVVEKAGKRYSVHEEYIELEVQSDGVYHDGVKIPGAVSSNKLKLSFAKGKADNPIVNGIIVYHDSIDNSPKADFENLKKSWDKQKELQKAMKEDEKLKEIIAIQKKKETIMIRNDQIIIEKTEEGAAQVNREKFGFIRRVFMGPVGILLWSGLIVVVLVFLHSKVFLMGDKPKSELKE